MNDCGFGAVVHGDGGPVADLPGDDVQEGLLLQDKEIDA